MYSLNVNVYNNKNYSICLYNLNIIYELLSNNYIEENLCELKNYSNQAE